MDILTTLANNVLGLAIVISIMVFIHEFGHYFVARLCGVKVETFSIGFGREMFGFTDKAGTRWRFSLLPLGGYVKMYGDANGASAEDKSKMDAMSEAERAISFHAKKLWQKALIVLAGPAANFLLAIAIFAGLLIQYGERYAPPVLQDIVPGSVAEAAGLQAGDEVLRLNGMAVNDFNDIRMQVSMHPNIPIEMQIKRGDEVIALQVTPQAVEQESQFDDKVKMGQLGVQSAPSERREVGVFAAMGKGVERTYDLSVMTLKAIGQMITGKRDTKDISGIIRIADYSGKAIKLDMVQLLGFLALISINLGLVNLFPIPVLDGGHLLFYAIQAVTRKEMAEKVQDIAFRLGYTVLILLMMFALWNDLSYFGVL